MKLNNIIFKHILDKNFTFEKKPQFAAAISGGADSMALLFLLSEWVKKNDGKLIALIINHNLRKNSSEECNKVNKFLLSKKIDSKILTVKKIQVTKKNMKEARDNRYKLLTNYCKKYNILHLFVAHHLDDNLETFIYRKISGSDFDGLQSMTYQSLRDKINIYRPLLNFSKNEIIQYNLKNKIPFIEDPSNYNLKYSRPVIRKFLKTIESKSVNKIMDEFQEVKYYSGYYNLMINEILLKIITKSKKNLVEINFKNLHDLENLLAEKIIKRIYQFFYNKKTFLRSVKIEIFLDAITGKKFTSFNLKGMKIKKHNDSLVFLKNTQ